MQRGLIAVILLLLALAAFLGWRLSGAHETVGQQKEKIEVLAGDVVRLQGQITAVDLMARMNDAFQLGLQRQNDQLQAAADNRQNNIKELRRENKDVRRWADMPLPADVIRMHRRPAITGAGGYHDFLSGDNALRAGGKQPENKR